MLLLVTLFITVTESKLEHGGRQHFLVLLLLFDFLLFLEKVSQVSKGRPESHKGGLELLNFLSPLERWGYRSAQVGLCCPLF